MARLSAWLVVVLAVGCGRKETAPAGTPPKPVVETGPRVRVFTMVGQRDGLVFAERAGEVFAQVRDGGEVRRYHLERAPKELAGVFEDWAVRQQTATTYRGGQIISEGPTVLIRHGVLHTESRGEYWSGFIDDQELQAFLTAVRAAMVKPERAVKGMPAWVTEDERVRRDFETAPAVP